MPSRSKWVTYNDIEPKLASWSVGEFDGSPAQVGSGACMGKGWNCKIDPCDGGAKTTVTATVSPAAAGTAPEAHFEFRGTFINGTSSRPARGAGDIPDR